ncbi:C4-dicarboxylate ABC transporter permease [Desulfonema ishimotonii]|uniref:C4-dicarboxylate ABC transporter permease n=1 Tax=Desulfonema ishimotonii TaxID=45657 RepID=A0A401G2E5_9BACT|nr:TRAP transporter small permease [Desulfonema ishimotonii]GBC63353.1 C4-dicarboxylate ABC transporter permease [Desulfonema ishimotonii]
MDEKREKKAPGKILRLIYRVEDGLLVGVLLVMMSMAVAQILMRNLLGSGIVWGDVLVRILVLWIGLLGAMIASRSGEHIRIDLASRYFPEWLRQAVDAVGELFTAGICLTVAWHSFRFVRSEVEYGGIAFASVPAWACEAVIPFAFAVIGLRYLLLASDRLKRPRNS